MKARWFLSLAAVWTTVLLASAAPQSPAPAPARSTSFAPASAADVRATLDRYCVTCHNERARTSATTSGVVLDTLDLGRVAADGEVWEKVVRKLRTGAMPPAGMPRPDPASHDAMVAYLETALDREAHERPDPGRPAAHRLNRAEYANAIRDLLALEVDPAALLPPDDSSDGFDNNADVLGLSPALLERYLSAAAKISALAVASPKIGPSSEIYRVRGDASQSSHTDGLPLGTRGGVAARHTFPLDGEYVVKVKLLEVNLGSIRGLQFEHQLEVTVDGERKLLAPVGGADDFTRSSINATDVVNALDQRLQVRVLARAGQRPVTAAFLDKASVLGGHRLQSFERTTLIATDHLGDPHVESITITGPFNATGGTDTPSRQRLFSCRPRSAADERTCATEIVSTLARRAYRRPVTKVDLDPLMAFFDRGRASGNFDSGIELALRGVLVSPKFIFRLEHDSSAPAGAPYRLTDLELASRLSFFSGAAFPTMSSSPWRRAAGSDAPMCSTRRCGGCLPIRAPVRWSTTSPASGCTCATCAAVRPTTMTSRTSTTTCARHSSAS
jgi:mono/diheme cytochrome c family protein